MNAGVAYLDSEARPLILKGKKGLIMGVANDKSLAWGIAESFHKHGASLAFTYQSDILLKRLEPLAGSVNCKSLYECDVASRESIDACFNKIEAEFGKIDFIVHSIGFSDKNELRGRFIDTSLDNFLNTMNISCYSLVAVAKRAERIMNKDGSIITLTYYGAEKTIPNYNVMGVAKAALECSVKYLASDMGPASGVRVNAISAGPMRTLAASGIGEFRSMLRLHEQVSPLRRNTTLGDVAGCAVYLASDLSSGMTGEIVHIDSGYNIVGMMAPEKSEDNQG